MNRHASHRAVFALSLASFLSIGCRGKGLDEPYGSGGGQAPPGDLCINEILYHPVLKDTLEEQHEFVEIFNRGDAALNLEGVSVKGIGFTFGDYDLDEGDYVIVAKNREALLANSHYELDPEKVVGDFSGVLSNDGETLRLETKGGVQVDEVTYNDGFPWPIAADGLGVGESWLAPELLPLAAHQHGGVSLERVSCSGASSSPDNWRPSSVDGATPGAENTSILSEPLPVVEEISAQAFSGESTITEEDVVRVSVKFTGTSNLADPRLEYFTDDLSIETEERKSADLDLAISSSALLEAAPANSIVRFRILGDRGEGEEVISPRPSDPYQWHSYFVDPQIGGETLPYHLFISPENWTQLWDNITDGRTNGCDVNESWQARVPAAFVHEGHVYDVQVRYQGSRWNRDGGPSLNFEGEGPDRPNPTMGLSWRIGFPRYDQFNERGVMILNKLTQGCPGYTAIAGFQLFREAGLPGTPTDYRRVFVNGSYYRYMLELHRLDGDLMRRYHDENGGGDVGHLFKSSGLDGNEGPWGWGNGSLLEEDCGYSASERYEYTYKRKTHDWDTTPMVEELIVGLHEARDESEEALRAYLSAQFDVEKMLTHYSIMATIGPWDDVWHNYGLYLPPGGKWMLVPWDLDRTFGGMLDPQASLFAGAEGDPDNVLAWNVIKDSFFQAYREEYISRLQELGRTSLNPSHVTDILDDAAAQANVEEAQAAPGGTDCNFEDAVDDMKSFIEERAEFIQNYSD